MAIYFAMPGNENFGSDLAVLTCGEVGVATLRRFPDGETYVRVLSQVNGEDVFIVCTLARPDAQFVGLAFLARELRQLGARRVSLIAPYLAYMRQDRIFQPGEALSSRLFAELLQQGFDALITVDPHLHRHASLDEVYDIPSTVVHARPLLANWIAANVPQPVVVGPDAEAAQWVQSIAAEAAAPWALFGKSRSGDRSIRMEAPDLKEFRGRTPVLVDDIISSGVTMKSAIQNLRGEGFAPPYCLGIHALCTARTARHIRDNSAGFLTSNSVPNDDAAFDVAPLIADALEKLAAASASRGRTKAIAR